MPGEDEAEARATEAPPTAAVEGGGRAAPRSDRRSLRCSRSSVESLSGTRATNERERQSGDIWSGVFPVSENWADAQAWEDDAYNAGTLRIRTQPPRPAPTAAPNVTTIATTAAATAITAVTAVDITASAATAAAAGTSQHAGGAGSAAGASSCGRGGGAESGAMETRSGTGTVGSGKMGTGRADTGAGGSLLASGRGAPPRSDGDSRALEEGGRPESQLTDSRAASDSAAGWGAAAPSRGSGARVGVSESEPQRCGSGVKEDTQATLGVGGGLIELTAPAAKAGRQEGRRSCCSLRLAVCCVLLLPVLAALGLLLLGSLRAACMDVRVLALRVDDSLCDTPDSLPDSQLPDSLPDSQLPDSLSASLPNSRAWRNGSSPGLSLAPGLASVPLALQINLDLELEVKHHGWFPLFVDDLKIAFAAAQPAPGLPPDPPLPFAPPHLRGAGLGAALLSIEVVSLVPLSGEEPVGAGYAVRLRVRVSNGSGARAFGALLVQELLAGVAGQTGAQAGGKGAQSRRQTGGQSGGASRAGSKSAGKPGSAGGQSGAAAEKVSVSSALLAALRQTAVAYELVAGPPRSFWLRGRPHALSLFGKPLAATVRRVIHLTPRGLSLVRAKRRMTKLCLGCPLPPKPLKAPPKVPRPTSTPLSGRGGMSGRGSGGQPGSPSTPLPPALSLSVGGVSVSEKAAHVTGSLSVALHPSRLRYRLQLPALAFQLCAGLNPGGGDAGGAGSGEEKGSQSAPVSGDRGQDSGSHGTGGNGGGSYGSYGCVGLLALNASELSGGGPLRVAAPAAAATTVAATAHAAANANGFAAASGSSAHNRTSAAAAAAAHVAAAAATASARAAANANAVAAAAAFGPGRSPGRSPGERPAESTGRSSVSHSTVSHSPVSHSPGRDSPVALSPGVFLLKFALLVPLSELKLGGFMHFGGTEKGASEGEGEGAEKGDGEKKGAEEGKGEGASRRAGSESGGAHSAGAGRQLFELEPPERKAVHPATSPTNPAELGRQLSAQQPGSEGTQPGGTQQGGTQAEGGLLAWASAVESGLPLQLRGSSATELATLSSLAATTLSVSADCALQRLLREAPLSLPLGAGGKYAQSGAQAVRCASGMIRHFARHAEPDAAEDAENTPASAPASISTSASAAFFATRRAAVAAAANAANASLPSAEDNAEDDTTMGECVKLAKALWAHLSGGGGGDGGVGRLSLRQSGVLYWFTRPSSDAQPGNAACRAASSDADAGGG
ncbi:hypothetical protein T492DRAFT_905337, partial [Pavlovales sp. CCMP2436]